MRKLTVLIFILISVNAYAGTPRPLQGIGITVSVTQNKDTGIYYYRYNVCNPTTNPMDEDGILAHIEIDISRTDNDAQLSWAGLYFSNDTLPIGKPPHISVTANGILNQYRDQFTPIGIERMPEESYFPIDVTTRWTIGFLFWEKTNVMSPAYREWPAEHVKGLLPGKCLNDFILSSPALPAIRYAKAESAYIMTKDDIPEEEATDPAYIQEFYNNIAWHGNTIGPKAPPANFVSVDFLNYIISLKQQAYQFGWIVQKTENEHDKDKDNSEHKPNKDKGNKGKETGIMQSLDTKLNHAMRELQAGKRKSAVNILYAFIGEVEGLYNVCREHEDHDWGRDNDDKDSKDKMHEQGITTFSSRDHDNKEYNSCDKSHLTSEGYALLEYNTEYLIERLGGKIRKYGHEDHDTKKDKD